MFDKDNLYGLRRTVVNAIVALFLGWLTKLGIEIDSEALQSVLDGIIVGAYWLISNWVLTVAPDWLKKVVAIFTGGAQAPTYAGSHEAP